MIIAFAKVLSSYPLSPPRGERVRVRGAGRGAGSFFPLQQDYLILCFSKSRS